MLSVRESYTLGYLTNLIGIHFNGAEILFNIKPKAAGELEKRVDSILESWPQKGPETVQHVRSIEELLQKENIPLDAPPRLAEEYYRWAEAIYHRFHQRLNLENASSSEEQLALFHRKWAYTIGIKIGDLQQNINLAVIVHHLLGSLVSNPWLEAQLQKLYTDFAESFAQLSMIAQKTALLQTFSETAQNTIHHLVSVFEQIDILGSNQNHDDSANKLQNQMKQIAIKQQELSSQF